MSSLQNLTEISKTTPVNMPDEPEVRDITPVQDDYITFVACDGLMVESGDKLLQISMGEYAKRIGVHRQTLYDWQKSIPDFWPRVTARAAEIFTRKRRMKIYNGLFLRAARGDAAQAALLLSHFPDAEGRTFQPPAQKHEVTASDDVVSLLNQARQRAREIGVETQLESHATAIEGEVVDAPKADS